MAVSGNRVTVNTTATPLWTDPPGGSPGKRKRVALNNNGSATVFVGGSGVTTTAYGHSLAATTGAVTLEVDKGDMLYGVVASATQVINVLVADI